MSERVLVLGNNTIDHVFNLNAPPPSDGKVNARSYQANPGGQAANVAVNMAMIGLRVAFVGSFGDDDAAEMTRRAFDAAGVDLTHTVVVQNCSQHVAAILVSEGQKSVVLCRDPRLALDSVEIPEKLVQSCSAVYTDGQEGRASLRLARLAKSAGIPVVADLESVVPHSSELVALTTHLIAPADTLRQLVGRNDLNQALRAILDLGPSVVVGTLGHAGAQGSSRTEGPYHVPAVASSVVDTTGCSDAYRAGYVVSLLRGDSLLSRLTYASTIAAVKCSTQGPRLTEEGLRAMPLAS